MLSFTESPVSATGVSRKRPAANKTFETDYFGSVRDAYTCLAGLCPIASTPARVNLMRGL